MKHFFNKKIITLLILLSFVAPHSAFALPVTVTSSPISDSQQIMGIIKEYGLDTLASSLVQVMSSKISNKVFNKANGGASGDSSQPSFIQSFSSYFGNLQSGQIDKFITDLGISNNPFAAEITKSLVTGAQGLSQGKGALESFNLDKVIGVNWKEFETNGNIGGWDGFLALSNPANTNIGSALIAKQDLASAIESAKELEKIKLGGSGTKPQGKCTLDFKDYKKRTLDIKNSRQDLKFQDQAFSQGAEFTNDDGTPMTDQQVLDATAAQQQQNATNSIGLAEDYGQCINELINNPVGLVTLGIDQAIKVGQEKLAAGDEIGELIGGLLMQMVGTFIKGGITSLQADFQSNKDSVGGPEQLVAKNGANIPWTNAPSTIIDMPVEFPPAVESTQAEVAAMTDYIERLTYIGDDSISFATTISKLDSCLPGPDYGYKKRLTAYTSKQTKKLDKRKNKGNSAKRNYKNIMFDDIIISVDDAKISMGLATLDSGRNIPGATAMTSQIQSIGTIQQKYSETKSELMKKQAVLNLLYSVESGLRTSIQTLSTYITNLPGNIPFSNYSWAKLGTSSTTLSVDQKGLLTWAKKLSIKMPPGVSLSADKLPLTLGDWAALTTAEKSAAVSWATATLADGDIRDTSITDRDFVLGTVWYMFGIDSRKTDFEIKRDYTLGIIWKVWVNPEQYMITPWDTEGADAKSFLTAKNKIRANYAALQNDITLPYTLQKAETSLRQLEEVKKKANELLADCITMKEIVIANPYTGADANIKYQALLTSNLPRFKSDEIKQAIRNKDGILSLTNANLFPDGVDVYDQATLDNIGVSNTSLLGKPYKDLGLAVPTGDNEDDYDPNEEVDRRVLNSDGAYLYQIPPARTLYELFDQGNAAFCTLNRFLAVYPPRLPNPTLDGGRTILCNDSGNDAWNTIGRNDIRAIIFGSNEDE